MHGQSIYEPEVEPHHSIIGSKRFKLHDHSVVTKQYVDTSFQLNLQSLQHVLLLDGSQTQ